MTVHGSVFDSGMPGASAASVEQAMLAHDIRGALQGVVGGIATLEMADLSPDSREQVDRISAAALALEGLVSIALGERQDGAEENGGSCSAGEVDLAGFIEHFLHRWSGAAHARGGRLALEAGIGLPDGIAVQHVVLDRVLGNLVSNAIKHGGGDIEVMLHAGQSGGLEFAVCDCGPGVDPDLVKKVLGPEGGQLPDNGAVHGLGLHIVRAFCDGAGFGFALSARKGGGTRATVSVPADMCIAARPVADPCQERVQCGDRPDLSGVRILLAEDNPTNQMVANQMLQALHASVDICSDGIEALELFEAGDYDLVVVDIEMPRLSGLDVIRRIRARADGKAQVPVVALTAYALREHRDRISEAGADGLISKPITGIEALGRGLAAHVRADTAQETTPTEEGGWHMAPAPADEVPPGAAIDSHTYDALAEAMGPEMMGELLDKVIADLEAARDEITDGAARHDRAPVRAASHILISVAGAVGATRLQECSRKLNTAAHQASDAELGGLVGLCLRDLDGVIGFARREFDRVTKEA